MSSAVLVAVLQISETDALSTMAAKSRTCKMDFVKKPITLTLKVYAQHHETYCPKRFGIVSCYIPC